MTKTTDQSQIVKREVGEKVKIFFGIDNEATKSLADGVIEAVVTTSSVDRTNENIITTGINTKTFMATGGPVLYGHDYSALPIGKTLKLTEMKNKIKAQFQLAVEEYDFAGTVYRLIKGGYLNSVSIGGIVRQWSDDYRTIEEMEMVEFSVVPVPANAEAVITQRALEEAAGKTTSEIQKEFEDFSRKVLVDKIKTLGDDEIKDTIKVLKNLVVRLEETAEQRSLTDDKTNSVKRIVLKDAKAVAEQSQRVIKTLKISIKEQSNE